MSEIKKRIEFNGLVISRISSWARDYIKERAKEEFCDDFGQTIAFIIKEVQEYEMLKSKFFNNEMKVQLIQENQVKDNTPRTKNGAELNILGGKKSE